MGLARESGLRPLIALYVQAHNEEMPHSAFSLLAFTEDTVSHSSPPTLEETRRAD
jgi:hypothetical protein